MTNPDTTSATAVAVITVSYGSASVLEPFLASIAPASPATPTRVIVADNRPGDGFGVDVVSAAAGAEYVRLPRNLGYGGAVNAVVPRVPAEAEWILVSNPDVVLHQGAIDSLLRLATSDDTIGSVGPAILTPAGDRYPSARAVPSLRTGIGHALFANLWTTNPWSRAYRNDRDTSTVPRDAGWLSGACLLIRRSAFEAIGGFDDGFFMYFEDVDLGYRLGKAGYRNVFDPAAEVTHSGAHSTTLDSVAMLRAHHDSAARFMAKKYQGPMLAPVRLVIRVSLAVRSRLERRRIDR